jgi:alpha-glucosidase
LPGCLYLYQGDELGLPEDEELPLDSIQDPMHFRSGGVDPGRDGCRVPLPWTCDPTANFGFSATDDPAPAWLPQPQWWGRYAAQGQAEDPSSMLSLYRDALRLRRTAIAPDAALDWLELGDQVLAFTRGEIACIANLGPTQVPLPDEAIVILASRRIEGRQLEPDCAVWVQLPLTDSRQDHRKILG